MRTFVLFSIMRTHFIKKQTLSVMIERSNKMRIHDNFIFALTPSFTTGFSLSMHRTRTEMLSGLTSLGIVGDKMNQNVIRLGFVGDVMIGRGIDAILPFSVEGTIHESYMKDANGYVRLAVRENGPLPHAELEEKRSSYIWGDLIEDLKSPDALIVNLETSLTRSNNWDQNKGIHYRSHPNNVESLSAIGVKAATLANNHVLDWGEEGLKETMRTLDVAGISYAGAGIDEKIAKKPTFLTIEVPAVADSTRGEEIVTVAVLAIGFPSAGVPTDWHASKNQCGVNVEEEVNEEVAKRAFESIQKRAKELRTVPDITIVSLHWGSNWNWGNPSKWRKFAHTLVDLGVDVVIGHSSHHVKGMEVYKNKFIAYGLGDFLNDYEGIVGQGYEDYRNDLSALYLPVIDLKTKELLQVDIIPCKIKHLKVQRATDASDVAWLQSTFNREGSGLGTSCKIETTATSGTRLKLEWKH